jgi:phospholipid/cholesterol/gamma-HCH transport system substrate-binding protein
MIMIFGKTKLELQLGVFVFIGLVILVTFVLLIGNFRTWTSGYGINVVFNFVNGVKIGAPVRFAGVDVGEVKAMEFIPTQSGTPKVRVVGWLNKEVKIPADSTVWVNTLGLLGEKYIEIMPGVDKINYLGANQELVGTDPIAMHEVAELAKDIAGDLKDIMLKIKDGQGTIGKLLNDDALYKELQTAITAKDGTIGKLLYNDSIYKELEALVQDIRKHPWKLLFRGKEK